MERSVGERSITPRLLYHAQDRSMTLGTAGSVFVQIYREDFTAESMQVLKQHELAFARERRSRIPCLSVLDVTHVHLLHFSKDAREAALELTREMAPYLLCSAVVFDRDGFLASAIRSLVTTVNVFAKQNHLVSVFGSVPEALTWIESSLDASAKLDFDPVETARAISVLRNHEG